MRIKRYAHSGSLGRPAAIKRSAGQAGPGTITGYVAVFHRADNPGTQYRKGDLVERIDPKAFENIGGQDVLCVWNHSEENLLGRIRSGTLRLNVDSLGLRYECDLPDTQLGRDMAVLIGRGDVWGSSFQAMVPNSGVSYSREGDTMIRVIRRISALIDVGPVAIPAFDGTSTRLAEPVRRNRLQKLVAAGREYRARQELIDAAERLRKFL